MTASATTAPVLAEMTPALPMGPSILAVGLLSLLTPGVIVLMRHWHEDDPFAHWLFNAPLQELFAFRALALGGLSLLSIGVILTVEGR